MSLKCRAVARIFVVAVGLIAFQCAWAQYYDDPDLGNKPVVSHPQDYKPLGIRAGGFMLHPGVQLAAEYTDNALYAYDDQQSDTVFHIRPYLNAQSAWNRHSLNVRMGADIARYADLGYRDYEDYLFTVNGRIDVKTRSYMSYGAQYLNLHEGLNSRDAQQGYKPTRYELFGANLGYDHTFNRLAVGGMLTWARMDFANAVNFDGNLIDNQDRDRETLSWMVRAGYQFRTDMQAFASYTGYKTSFDEPYDRNGYLRSGTGYHVSAGLGLTLTGKLNGDIYATYAERTYDDPRLPKTSGWGGGASLTWTPTYLTTVYGKADTSVQETTNRAASGYLRTLYSLRVDHELRRFVQINGFVSYMDNEYQLLPGVPEAIARSWDKIYRYGVGVSWFINRHMYLNASYGHEKMKTNVPLDGYDTNRIWLTLGLER